MSANTPIAVTVRPSAARGAANHGWLNSYHTFSFANYYDPKHSRFGPLRVINEDRVSGGNGFGKHPHHDFEIFSYIVSGALKHNDSLGNEEILRRGEVQFTSTGSGIRHSEYNGSKTEVVHFLQMWVVPNKKGLPPRYQTKKFDDAEKQGKLRLIISPDGTNGSAVVANDVLMYASLLSPGQSTTFTLPKNRQGYLHLVMDATGYSTEANETALTLTIQPSSSEESKDGAAPPGTETIQLKGGDGAYLRLRNPDQEGTITITGAGTNGRVAEFVLFDLPRTEGAADEEDDDDD